MLAVQGLLWAGISQRRSLDDPLEVDSSFDILLSPLSLSRGDRPPYIFFPVSVPSAIGGTVTLIAIRLLSTYPRDTNALRLCLHDAMHS